MSKMGELHGEITELLERGMTEKYIAVTLNVPIEFVMEVHEDRLQLEQMKMYEYYEERE